MESTAIVLYLIGLALLHPIKGSSHKYDKKVASSPLRQQIRSLEINDDDLQEEYTFSAGTYEPLLSDFTTILPPVFTLDDCLSPVQIKPCFDKMGYQLSYRWDHYRQRCTLVPYGGCYPTKNNFPTIEKCWSTAGPVCTGYRFKLSETLPVATKNLLCHFNVLNCTDIM